VLGIRAFPRFRDQRADELAVERRFILCFVQTRQQLELLARRRLDRGGPVALVALSPLDGLPLPPLFHRVFVVERGNGDAADVVAPARARHHREIARCEVTRLGLRLFDADTDLHRGASDVIQPCVKFEVARDLDRPAQNDLVDRRRHCTRLRLEPAYVTERRVLGHLVEDFEKETEPQISLERLVDNHESTAQFRVCGERQRVVDRRFGGADHGAS